MGIYCKLYQMAKIVRLTERDLARIVKKVIQEQFPKEFKRDEPDQTDLGQEMDDRNKEITKAQLKDIVMNFSKINCDDITSTNEFELFGKKPERDIIYCLYYKGKSRAEMMKRLKSL